MDDTTTGIATEINLSCKKCEMKAKTKVRRTNHRNIKFRTNSSESFAINCQFTLGLMQVGCGSAEAGVLLSFMDLPHNYTFQRNTFGQVQLAMRPAIMVLTEKCM